jgi:hypothetical protein
MTQRGFVPEDEEENALGYGDKDRPKIEIEEEMLIDYIKSTNNWDYQIEKNKKFSRYRFSRSTSFLSIIMMV